MVRGPHSDDVTRYVPRDRLYGWTRWITNGPWALSFCARRTHPHPSIIHHAHFHFGSLVSPHALGSFCLVDLGVWLGRHSSTGTTGCEALRIAPGLAEDHHQSHHRHRAPPLRLGNLGWTPGQLPGLFAVVGGWITDRYGRGKNINNTKLTFNRL